MNLRHIVLSLALVPSLVAAQAYPNKAINYVIPFPPGGESDIVARWQQELFAKKFAPHNMVVINRVGAGGALAWAALNREPTDGSSVTGVNLPHLILQPLEGNVQYKTDDITPVYFYHFTPDAIIVPNSSPYKTLNDLLAAARAKPGDVTFAGSALNSANHAAHARFEELAKIKSIYIPFKGTGDLVSSLLGGHVSATMSYVTLAVSQKEKVRMLAIATDKRHPLFPNTPTFKELGFNWVDGAYRGVGVAKGTPEATRKQVSQLFKDLNADAELRRKKQNGGFELVDIGYEQMPAFMSERTKAYADDAKRLGLVK
jgi:tripartite-type tricarboxylate transporter receptor subunit TctC